MAICTELGRRGHEQLTLLAAHASKRMDGSTGVEPAGQSCLGKTYQCGGNREIPRFLPTALDMAQSPPSLALRISEILPEVDRVVALASGGRDQQVASEPQAG
jgi:hypothetical protein